MIRTIVATGGGSAGHVLPAIPVLRQYLDRGVRVVFVGSRSGLEAELLADLPIEYHGIVTGKLRRYFSWKNLADALRVPIGILQATLVLGRVKPDVVFSKGGYVGFPVVVAAWLRRIPVVAHESDVSPGLANRLSAPLLSTLCVSFSGTRASARRTVVTGAPLRPEILEGDRNRGREWLGFHSRSPVLCVVGGSLGAEYINLVVREALTQLLEMTQIVHVCGHGKLDPSLEDRIGYRQFTYVGKEWGDVLAATDLAISRAGANSLAELLALRIPSLLVPLPATASRGDQIENAQIAESQGYGRSVEQESLTTPRLVREVERMLSELSDLRKSLERCEFGDGTGPVMAELDRAADLRENTRS